MRDTAPDIGTVIHNLRREANLTLDELSRRSGVSKSMLSQIERNQSNPTFATVWGLTQALGVSLEDVLPGASEKPAVEVISEHQIPVIRSADGKCHLKILGPIGMAGKMEWYEVLVEAGGALISEPHEEGTIEHLSLTAGKLAVEFGGQAHELSAGETIRYPADQPHAIYNRGGKDATALLVCSMGGG